MPQRNPVSPSASGARARPKKKLAPDFNEGVDRKLLKQIKERFLSVNEERLAKANAALSLRHQDILALLPLLFQVNHPLLPGFIDREVPRGLVGYEPSKMTLSVARTFSQSFKYRQERRRKPQLKSLFMMGSSGTLAHSDSSDIDLWLCHEADLGPDAVALLGEKAQKIDEWANTLGLELHTFLMDADAFRREEEGSQVDAESSGSAQHFLLLDEFYRTAVLLAGCYPLWWLIPPEMESDYERITSDLLTKRFVKSADVIDFGAVAHIPKSELVGAGLWQLYKSLDAPYKSVLKLLLAEVYAQELPAQPCLSLVFKQSVYDDELSVEELDPYYLIYKRLERYLVHRNEIKRLQLVRKSFYLKVDKALSKRPLRHGASWQRSFLEKIVRAWAWPDREFVALDQRRRWKVDQVLLERQELLAELTHCYRFLSNYARSNNIVSSITATDLTLLGRKLYATFQRKAGKIDRVNPGIAEDIWEENLAIHHTSSQSLSTEQNNWLLYRDIHAGDDPAFHASLRKSSSLLELLAWLHYNEILNKQTRLSLNPGTSGVAMSELRAMVSALQKSIPMPLDSVSQALYMKPAYVKRLVLFINIGIDPMASLSEQGLLRLSDRTDSLVYSSQRYNLVKTIDQLALNSWNELSTGRYELGETLMQTLQAYLLMCASQTQEPDCQLDVYCYSSVRAEAIASRVKRLFDDVRQRFFQATGIESCRYVLEIEERFYVIQWIDQQFRYQAFTSRQALFHCLAKPAPEYTPIALDRYALQGDVLARAALRRNRPGSLQIFYQRKDTHIDVCALDEYGSMLCFVLPLLEEERLLSNLDEFLETVIERRQLDQSMLGRDQLPVLEFARVQVSAKAREGLEVITQKRIKRLSSYPLVATAYYQGEELCFDLSYDGRDFTFSEYDQQQYAALKHFLEHSPGYDDRIPLVLVDLSYPSDPMLMRHSKEQQQSVLDYLTLYAQIVAQLNQA